MLASAVYNTRLCRRIDFHYIFLEIVTVDSSRFQPVAVGIDGVERVIQYLGYACGIVYTHALYSQNTQIGVEAFALGELYAAFRSEQVVDTVGEIGVEMEKGVVEHVIEIGALFFDEASGFDHAVEFVCFAGRYLALGEFAEAIEFCPYRSNTAAETG